jgi:hypothetical protein
MDITERKRLEQEILVVSEGGQRRIGRHLGNFVPASRRDPIMGDAIFCPKRKPSRRA